MGSVLLFLSAVGDNDNDNDEVGRYQLHSTHFTHSDVIVIDTKTGRVSRKHIN